MKKTFVFTLVACCFLFGEARANLLINSGFESPWTGGGISGNGYIYAPTGDDIGWTFNAGAGVSGNGTAWGGSTPYGNQFAFLQLGDSNNIFGPNGSFLKQDFILSSSANVRVDFSMALRPNYATGQQIAVALDGNIFGVFDATTTEWSSKSLDLGIHAAGSHTLAFAGTRDYITYGDTSAYLDDVRLVTTPVPVPGTLLIFSSGLMGLMGFRTRKKNGVTS